MFYVIKNNDRTSKHKTLAAAKREAVRVDGWIIEVDSDDEFLTVYYV